MSPSENNGYSAKRYRTPDGAPADIVIFTIVSSPKNTIQKSLPLRELQVMLIQRKAWPFEGMWALPGGFSKETETLRETAMRELEEETGVENVHCQYLNVYSTPGRDPRGWIISHAFFSMVREELLQHRRAATDAADVRLFSVDEALESLELAFDHRDIIRDALDKLKEEVLRTTLAKQFLPDEFTLGELYQVIRTIIPSFQEDNFIRKLKTTRRQGILEPALDAEGAPVYSTQFSQRPAQLFRFTGNEPEWSIYG
ncbi:NUDIX domain-containing protein [Cohnella faecalis]|uniref:NUDIX domain-containing protein n=1 Tax=Cohnella faecalis TaxID=2315694 RepID=A0A398CQE1_9BACL|nr:NUDIX domain-containing protein [Cohnella faecalis]RIE03008.1 NUDIX domain-containing protein [Cohnella faecalis]